MNANIRRKPFPGRAPSRAATWLTCCFATLMGIADARAAAAPGIEATSGDALDGKVAWNAGVVATPGGLSVDGRAASIEPTSRTIAKSALSPKALINPGSLSGLWFDPAQDGHGFSFTFVEREGANDLFAVAWYVYRNGVQVWLSGVGEIVGNSATAQVVVTTGGQFPPLFNPGSVSRTNWGTVSITVISCSRIQVSWAPVVAGYAAGSLIAQPLAVSGGTGAAACQVTGGGGGGGGGDDHGNTCASASAAVVPGSAAGTINPATDTDFFRINIGAATTLTAQSSGISSLDPLATLFDANCTPLASNDDGGGGLNFLISRAVPAGTYFLGVGSFGQSSTGNYSVAFGGSGPPPGNPVTLAFTNRLLYPIAVRANGTLLGQVAAGGTATQTVSPGSTLDVAFEMVRPSLSGNSLGDPVAGFFNTISNPTGTINFTIGNVIGTTQYFVPLVSNNTAADLLMGVNMGLQSENRCNCVAPAFQQSTAFGYYRLFSNSNVRAYRSNSSYTGPFIFWNVSSAESLTGIVRLTASTAP